jgi:hypothetical protein
MANISHRIGQNLSQGEIREHLGNAPLIQQSLEHFNENLRSNGIQLDQHPAISSPPLEFAPDSERFTGPLAAQANALLDETYRSGHELPDIGTLENK